MIKEGPFLNILNAREAAQEVANRDRKTQYIVQVKGGYFFTDEKPEEQGSTVYYRLEDIVDPL